jgi:hypothetical protein
MADYLLSSRSLAEQEKGIKKKAKAKPKEDEDEDR